MIAGLSHFDCRPLHIFLRKCPRWSVINSTVLIRLSSQRMDGTQTRVEESSDDCKSKNVHY